MDISGATMLFVLLGGMAGFVIGALCGYFLSARQKTNAQKKEEIKKKKLSEVAVLWRERANGRLIIEAENLFKTKLDGFNPEKVKEIQQALTELIPKTSELAVGRTEPETSKPSPSAKPEAPGSLGNITRSAGEDSRILQELAQIAAGTFEEKPNVDESIVMQIDKVLQKLLADSEMKNRAIRLGEDPAHGVIVWIGVERFNGIDAVMDPDVKDMIHKAVAEWENSSKMKK